MSLPSLSKSISGRRITFALFVLALTLPYLCSVHRSPMPSFYNEFLAAVLWVAIIMTSCVLSGIAPHVSLPRVAWVPAGLASVLCLQMAVMTLDNAMVLHLALMYLGGATMAAYVGYRLRDMRGLTAVVAIALVVGAVLSLVIQTLQGAAPTMAQGGHAMFGGLVEPRDNGRLYGNLTQANHMASYLAWALAGVLYLRERSVLGRRDAVALVTLVISGMVMTGSRMALLHIAAIGVLFALAEWQHPAAPGISTRRHALRAIRLPVALVLGYFVLYATLGWLDHHYWHLGVGNDDMARLTNGGYRDRIQLWRYGWRMFLHAPWLGGGWGGFTAWEYANLEQFGTVTTSLSAHNIVLDLLAQTGVLGCGIFLIGLAAWIWRARLWVLNGKRAFWLCVIAVVMIHALLEYPLDYTYFLFPVAFAMGLLDSASVSWMSARAASLLCTMLIPPALAILLLLASDSQKLDRLYHAPNVLAAFPAYWNDQAVILSRLGSFAVAAGISVNGAHPEARLAMQRDALALSYVPGTITNYIVALALLGRDDEALDQVRRMKLAWPKTFVQSFGLLLWRCDQQGGRLTAFVAKLEAMHPTEATAVSKRPSPKLLMGGGALAAEASISSAVADGERPTGGQREAPVSNHRLVTTPAQSEAGEATKRR